MAVPGAAVIVIGGIIGLVFACVQLYYVSCVEVVPIDGPNPSTDTKTPMLDSTVAEKDPTDMMLDVYEKIRNGATTFLIAEYTVCAVFIVVFGAIVLVLCSYGSNKWDFKVGGLTAAAFVVGSCTSIISGWIGMQVAVYANVRTTQAARDRDNKKAWTLSFNTAFRAGGVMGFSLTGLGLLFLGLLIAIYSAVYSIDGFDTCKTLFECIAGFGLGGSSIALFGRVGGGIYTKAADVGADLAGKVMLDLDEDDPRNPACIADNVGDNVGDVAGMGSDLFGSFGEASCAALLVGSQCPEIVNAGFGALLFPLYISAVGIVVCLLTSFVNTHIFTVKTDKDVFSALKTQIIVSTILMTAATIPIAYYFLPTTGHFVCAGLSNATKVPVDKATLDSLCNLSIPNMRLYAFLCVVFGLWGGCIIGVVTEYYTSFQYYPVQELARSTETGAATNIIYGLALGYKSAIIPSFVISAIIYVAFYLMGMYGIALSALGMLSTLATCLSIDVYGPICDNAGGLAEMSGCRDNVRERTDVLDAAGNTTAAIGKGFAIGSAALTSLALFGAFITRTSKLETYGVNMIRPITFAFLVIGAMLPYWFTAMTMKSVGIAALAMVKEVLRQMATIPGLKEGRPGVDSDYQMCIDISTKASLREMILPGLLVIFSPIITGIFFGVEAVSGLLAGGLVSGVQLALSASNTGGAWDNAKKWIEKGELKLVVNVPRKNQDGNEIVDEDGNVVTDPVEVIQEKGSECHKAAVVGDTVGDPLKDTSGPALNILMKLMAIISVVFADFFMSLHNGEGVLQVESWQKVFTASLSKMANTTMH